jgi:hypothetical protein
LFGAVLVERPKANGKEGAARSTFAHAIWIHLASLFVELPNTRQVWKLLRHKTGGEHNSIGNRMMG